MINFKGNPNLISWSRIPIKKIDGLSHDFIRGLAKWNPSALKTLESFISWTECFSDESKPIHATASKKGKPSLRVKSPDRKTIWLNLHCSKFDESPGVTVKGSDCSRNYSCINIPHLEAIYIKLQSYAFKSGETEVTRFFDENLLTAYIKMPMGLELEITIPEGNKKEDHILPRERKILDKVCGLGDIYNTEDIATIFYENAGPEIDGKSLKISFSFKEGDCSILEQVAEITVQDGLLTHYKFSKILSGDKRIVFIANLVDGGYLITCNPIGFSPEAQAIAWEEINNFIEEQNHHLNQLEKRLLKENAHGNL